MQGVLVFDPAEIVDRLARGLERLGADAATGRDEIVIGAGLGASVQALARRPIEVLRAEVG